ncbi:putative virion structural protein [Erwinia phage vB_EamM_RisingSun]|uniref:Putative virion structural protein n=1 Tax=Erwinia phage vB_EamM_RisingSun TaxID=2026080 RepID=A0A223LHS7_9CAUD|nr:putative virion structural protein [Erwinia phage vB_EamM_RisingSun]ASU03571.1 putative virion structural protein [Erwinia phage vB_EamM_RisingSun]
MTMNFPIVQQYKFDIDGTNPENKITDEPIKTPAGIWNRIIVPVNGPFFVDTLVLTLPNGKPLVEEVDYRIFRMMGKLSEFCARDVACIIELIKPEITDVLATYHTVGETTLFDRSMLLLIMDAVNDDRPVWWENVLNKPVAFPPTLHGHSLIYEMVAFQDMVSMIDELLDFLNDGHRDLLELKIDHLSTLIDWYISLYTQTLTKYLERHEASYNAHGLTAAQAGADLIDNFPTATLTQSLQGERSDLVIKPAGLKALMQEYGYNSDFFLETNIIPLSRYGARSFIPPSIDGNFEGLGAEVETTGICMESDGSLSILSNHWDGRTEGLYFSTCPNYQVKVERIFTGFKYTHQKIIANGQEVTRVIGGTNHEVIMVGRPGTPNWFVGLSKGTLNPSKHILSKVNMKPINDAIGNPNGQNYNSHDKLSVHLMGNWVYFIQTYSGPLGENGSKRLFRVPRASVEAGLDVTPTSIKITYKNWDGKQYNSVDEFIWGSPTFDSNNAATRYLFNFNPAVPTATTGGLYRAAVTLSCAIPNKANAYVLKFMSHFWIPYIAGNVSTAIDCSPELVYEFNPDTGVMTLISKSDEPGVVDMTKGNVSVNTLNENSNGLIVANWSRQAAVVLPNGDVVFGGSSLYSYPHYLYIYKTGQRTPYETMKLWWSRRNFPASGYASATEIPVSPIVSGIQQIGVTYDNEGEFYTAYPQNALNTKYLYHRTVTGDYAKREGVNNLIYPNYYSRPVGGVVKRIMAMCNTPRINITGTATQISKYGLNLGWTGFGMGPEERFWRRTQNSNWTPGTNDNDIMLVTAHNKRDNGDGTISLIPTKQVLWPAAIVNQLKNLIPAAYRSSPDIAVSIIDFSDGPEGKFGSFPAIVQIYYVDVSRAMARQMFLTVRPTYSAPSGIRRTVTGYTILGSLDVDVMGSQTDVSTWQPYFVGGVNGSVAKADIYLNDDGTMEVDICSGVASQHAGNNSMACARFTINKSTGQLVGGIPYNYQEAMQSGRHAVPKVGIGQNVFWGTGSGGSALINGAGGNYYMLASCYPESGWVVYFQKAQEVVFNGTSYTLPQGTIDLRDIEPSPGNKTFYLYCEVKENKAAYQISTQKLEDTPFHMWIGIIRTNEKQILTIDRFNVFTLNGQRVSETRRGSALPASSGAINSLGQIPWLKPSEIIQG